MPLPRRGGGIGTFMFQYMGSILNDSLSGLPDIFNFFATDIPNLKKINLIIPYRFSTKCPTEMTLVPFDSAHQAGLNDPKITSVSCLVWTRRPKTCPFFCKFGMSVAKKLKMSGSPERLSLMMDPMYWNIKVPKPPPLLGKGQTLISCYTKLWKKLDLQKKRRFSQTTL